MHKFTRKTMAVSIALVLLVGAGGAYAYWTNSGSGTGSATTGTNVAIVVNQTSTVADMAPGVAAQPLSGTFTNLNTGPVYVATVTASIASVVKAGGAPAGTCDATDYILANPVVTVGREIAAGTGVDAWTGPTLQFDNKGGTNQDACKLATVNLAYASS